jgi:hypothetical protein
VWVLNLVRDCFPFYCLLEVWGTIGTAETQLKFFVRGRE